MISLSSTSPGAAVLAVVTLGGLLLADRRRMGAGLPRRRVGSPRRIAPAPDHGARWATRRDLRPLRADDETRLALGWLATSSWRRTPPVLRAERAQSIAVIGPTQSGKTTGLAIPAILSWRGPVVASSVKTDLVRDTRGWRATRGRVWCFDPSSATGLPADPWSPLRSARTWPGARRVAADLTEVTRAATTSADGEFWYATAAKLLAPLLFAAATGDRTMADVVRWVDTQEVAEVLELLEAANVRAAIDAARATWQRDERQRSAVFTTAETLLEPFADAPARPDGDGPIDPAALLRGEHTLYLCAPAHDQRRLRGLFSAVVKDVLETAFSASARAGRPLDPPLLVVLDEAANIAPLAELDGLAATCAGHGVQLVTVWQDLAQLTARYGARAATVLNNHRGRIFLSGIADPSTLDHASHLVGETEVLAPTVTRDPAGGRSTATATQRRPLLAPHALRQFPAGTGLLVYGTLPPARIAVRPWWTDPRLAGRARPPAPPAGPRYAAEVAAPTSSLPAGLSDSLRSAILDPADRRWSADPWPLYEELRRRAPVCQERPGFWILSRHADCLAVLRDRRASSDVTAVDPALLPPSVIGELVGGPPRDARPFLFRDPPDHTRLRGLVQKAFTPRMVDTLRPRVAEIVDELLDEALARGAMDAVADFAYPLPVRIICEMLGVPAEDQQRFSDWSGVLARGLDPETALSEVQRRAQGEAAMAIAEYFVALLAERRAHPGDELLSQLVAAEEAGDQLSEGELLSTAILLLIAGHETTVNLLSGGLLALLEQPDQLELLRLDPLVVQPAVEELLRYVSPVQRTGRWLLRDLEVGGQVLPRGAFVTTLVASANRDPEAFEQPDRLDLARQDNRHLGFGFGLHHCLGAPLARLEAAVALPALLRRARSVELAGPVVYRENVVLRGLAALPVTLRAA
ncbi:MAG TPA: cytochrome P450 [Acidimicrobiales bacterium]|nr:cytochrome P450 [Acidimicrobiales bacterium]